MHTLLVHVGKSGTHKLRWETGEKDNMNNDHSHIVQKRVRRDARMGNSLAVMFHVFPVCSEEERKQGSHEQG